MAQSKDRQINFLQERVWCLQELVRFWEGECRRLRDVLLELQDLLSDGPGGPRRATALKCIAEVLADEARKREERK
jgi:hypothetical protein